MLKLNSGPDKANPSMLIPSSFVKWPKYMKTFKAQSIPHKTKLAGIM